jgi:oligoendopeptidase F
MSLSPIPNLPAGVDPSRWETIAPLYEELHRRPLDVANAREWLAEWSALTEMVSEIGSVIYIESSQDTADKDRERAFLNHVENFEPQAKEAEQALKLRLLSLGEADSFLGEDMAMSLRIIRNEADLFRMENVPLFTELSKLGNEYDKLTGRLKADWDGEEKNLSELGLLLRDRNRATRQRAWETIMSLWAGERETLNELYRRMLVLRVHIARNAGEPDYRAYSFREKNRFAYTPEDTLRFHEAIERVVVPAAGRVYARKRAALGVESLRPWDLDVDTAGDEPLKPYNGQDDLIRHSLDIFQQVDPGLARYLATMAEASLLDLDTRKGKALGGYCAALSLRKQPFIFMNGVGTHDNVQTMLHEAGHAFHSFESFNLPFEWQRFVPMEFCEVASMGMELLAAPYLTADRGGFYTQAEAARARIEHLEGILTFWPYMAVVDAFQHWVYTHPDLAQDAAACDATWDDLWARFMPGVDWSGYEAARMTGWHRKLHIFQVPFYYVEYGMAQVGAVQVWRNALRDQAGAVRAYRKALALGGTRSLPELYAAAGAEFRFDEAMLTDLVGLIETTLDDLARTQ